MQIDLYSATGTKKGSLELPAALFEATINKGLMHLAVVRQQSNRRMPIAHVKHRGEIVGTTKKAYAQKHTGRARRGALRSPTMRGGGKAFGPRNDANFRKEMPKKMRRAALFSCLSLRAKEGAIIGLENYPEDAKTKNFVSLLQKLPLDIGRRIMVVTAGRHSKLELAARNVPKVKTVFAQYLNPEDVLLAQKIIFLEDAVKLAEETFTTTDTLATKKSVKIKDEAVAKEAKPKKEPKVVKEKIKKPAAKKKAAPKTPKVPKKTA
jgi:large subunit ribosomal protein L4